MHVSERDQIFARADCIKSNDWIYWTPVSNKIQRISASFKFKYLIVKKPPRVQTITLYIKTEFFSSNESVCLFVYILCNLRGLNSYDHEIWHVRPLSDRKSRFFWARAPFFGPCLVCSKTKRCIIFKFEIYDLWLITQHVKWSIYFQNRFFCTRVLDNFWGGPKFLVFSISFEVVRWWYWVCRYSKWPWVRLSEPNFEFRPWALFRSYYAGFHFRVRSACFSARRWRVAKRPQSKSGAELLSYYIFLSWREAPAISIVRRRRVFIPGREAPVTLPAAGAKRSILGPRSKFKIHFGQPYSRSHAKFHHRTTSYKKTKPLGPPKKTILGAGTTFHMLGTGIEQDILDWRWSDFSLWTNKKVRL